MMDFDTSSSSLLITEKPQDDLQNTTSFTDDSTKLLPQDNKTAFFSLIENLNLLDKYPQKLKLVDALMIRTKLLNVNNTFNDIHSLPYLVLQKIMMHDDYRPLCKLTSKQLKLHPVDILLVLLHCCDNILRQDLLSRLHTCKLAIPLLLPDPNNKTITLLLWALRSIVCEWKCKISEAVTSKEKRMVDHKIPIITFLRIGSAKSPKEFSKSHMLNIVIGDQKYFFHWNCPGGSYSRKFVDGMVELSCYLPSGKDTDNFSNSVIFLNLRGEARKHTMQLDFIKKVSFMTFVILLEKNLDDGLIDVIQELAVLPGGLVIIFPNYEYTRSLQNSDILFKIMSERDITAFNVQLENEDGIKSQIQNLISQKLSASNLSRCLALSECASIAQNIGLRVDEDNADCKEGQSLANKLIQIIKRVPATEAKAQILPLQGPELWHKWAKHDKESFQKSKVGNGTVAYFNKTVEKQKKDVRQKQWQYVAQSNPLMKTFISSLQTYKGSVRTYILQWLKMFLDDRSREILPGMRAEYEQIRGELQKAEEGGNSEKSTIVKNLINKLKKQNRSLIEGSLGIEHLFREVGQMYEAVKHCTNQQHAIDHYPKIMADILIQGYPVELMDGDASHVPITWVLAILDQLKTFHRKKRLFIISVLGIQSTGKSTLLNTMFGLQFNVSAGRCTRGAFMQLLPVENCDTQKPSCDFVLIVDTEGLRAPELISKDSYLHDNELATFVIGLADVAIINIYGESPGDLNDILQTSVHAFIRMKNVNVNLSCHFVHQNVTALVDSKITFGQQMFQDKLNEMTKYAAIAEHCESKYTSFQDVIKFDGTSDITYFPGLWNGEPPMAPVYPGYSYRALQLKSKLMALADLKIKNDPSFDNFQLLFKTLWNAVCRENYIFSFKNTKEIVAYNDLDAAFSQWSWTFHRKMLEWRYQTRNSVSNCPSNEVSAVVTTCLNKARNMLQVTYKKLTEEMNTFFEDSVQSDTLAQWRPTYTRRLETLKEECTTEAKKQCELLEINRKRHTKLEEIQKQHRKQLLQQIQQLVAEAKQNNTTLSQRQLEKKFDEKWQIWIKEFSTNSEDYQKMYTSNDDIDYLINQVLDEILTKYSSELIHKLKKISLSKKEKHGLHLLIDCDKHLRFDTSTLPDVADNPTVIEKIVTFLGFPKRELDNVAAKQAQKATDDFFTAAINAFRRIRKDFHSFNKSCAFDLLKEFVNNIESYNAKHGYMFTSEYIVDMALAFAHYMIAEFIKLMDEVRTANDPMISLKRLREAYFNTFLVQFSDISGDDTAACNLCQLLSVAIETAVSQILPSKIEVHMKGSDAGFKTKAFFKVKVLKDLAAERNFELFKTYLLDIKSSFEYWTERYVREFCMANNNKNLQTLVRLFVHDTILEIDATVQKLDKNIPIKQWLQRFHERLNETLTINLNELEDIIGATRVETISEYFVSRLSKQLTEQEEKIMERIVDPNSKFSDITKWNTSPHITLCDSLIGCTAQCPFCKEQCELTDSNHVECGKDHFIQIHRPECLGKYTWDKTKQLVLDLCTYSVDSDNRFRNADTNDEWVPYKNYRSIYKNWCFSNESNTEEAPKYWQWFISHYLKEIIEWVGAAPTSIDHLNWGAVSPEMAVASLSEVYKIS